MQRYLTGRRAEGCTLVLATAADAQIARQIAAQALTSGVAT